MPGHEPRDVDEGDEGDVEGVAGADEPGPLLRGVDVEHAGQHLGLVADDADGPAVDAGEPADQVHGPVVVDLEELAVVDHRLDDLLHVVGLVGRGGHELGQLGGEPLGIVARIDQRGLLQVVGREEAEQVADVVQARLLVGGHEGGHPGLGGVAHRPAQLLEGHVLAGHRLDHVGTGDEHVAGPLDHEDEVGHGRAVDRAPGTGAEDHADLGDDPGGLGVAVEDARRRSGARPLPPGCGRRRRR